jgi:hypothetical protein
MIHTKWNSHNTIKYPQYKVTVTHFTSLHFTSLHFTSLHFTSLHFSSLHFISFHFTELQEVLNFMAHTFSQIVMSKSPLAAVMHKAGSIASLSVATLATDGNCQNFFLCSRRLRRYFEVTLCLVVAARGSFRRLETRSNRLSYISQRTLRH